MKINEIFYSLQGEGYFTGTPSVFIRFSGCNLQCPFCDTVHKDGVEMSIEEITAEAQRYPASHVVITGGEPSLFLTDELVTALHMAGKYITVETNGTHPLPKEVDWITLSPKDSFISSVAAKVQITNCDEIKVVFQDESTFDPHLSIAAAHRFVQPCDVGDEAANRIILQTATAYCLSHPQWRLSLQTHKIIGVR